MYVVGAMEVNAVNHTDSHETNIERNGFWYRVRCSCGFRAGHAFEVFAEDTAAAHRAAVTAAADAEFARIWQSLSPATRDQLLAGGEAEVRV